MGVKIIFGNIEKSKDYGPWPLKEHPVVLHVDAYQKDAQGTVMTDVDGNPTMYKTTAGDTMWRLRWESLEQEGREILDNINFSSGGQKRVRALYVRAGLASGEETEEMDLEPEDIDGSKWWIKPVHEVRCAQGIYSGKKPENVDQGRLTAQLLADYIRNDKVKTNDKYKFDAKDCRCNVCQACDGQYVNVDTRVTFEGFKLMEPKDAAKFSAGGQHVNGVDKSAGKLCGQCVKGDHSHSFKKNNCECEDQTHPDF